MFITSDRCVIFIFLLSLPLIIPQIVWHFYSGYLQFLAKRRSPSLQSDYTITQQLWVSAAKRQLPETDMGII